MKSIRIALCQINPTVGDLCGNIKKIDRFIEKSLKYSPNIIAFPELSITGYPPEDLLLNPEFIKDNLTALSKIQKKIKNFIAIIGFVDRNEKDIYNSAAIIHNKKIIDVYHKICLPNYGVFDECRYFRQGNRYPVYRYGTIKFGVTICEDIWSPESPAIIQSAIGADFIININASPYYVGKSKVRFKILSKRAIDNSVSILYLNMVGGQDELVFDGHSLIVDDKGTLVVSCKPFEEDIIIFDINSSIKFSKKKIKIFPNKNCKIISIPITLSKNKQQYKIPTNSNPLLSLPQEEEIFKALVLGTKDYVIKNGFKKVCIGLSGGIDSSFVSVIATKAIGKENVIGVFMPSQYTSLQSKQDVSVFAQSLGIKILKIPITNIFKVYLKELKTIFKGRAVDTTEENLQARIRGNILMALSNKFGWLVLTTGNKSETSVGYTTLYGDTAGGFAVIKDIPKTLIYKICYWLNKKTDKMIIPQNILTKEPTAELKSNQKDTDTLPPYNILDSILKVYIEDQKYPKQTLSSKYKASDIKKIINRVNINEYKRRQSPPGIKITKRAFGKDWRFPITNKYRR